MISIFFFPVIIFTPLTNISLSPGLSPYANKIFCRFYAESVHGERSAAVGSPQDYYFLSFFFLSFAPVLLVSL